MNGPFMFMLMVLSVLAWAEALLVKHHAPSVAVSFVLTGCFAYFFAVELFLAVTR